MPTLSITYDAAQAARIVTAWEHKFGVTPTQAMVKAWLAGKLRYLVQTYEKEEAAKVLADTPFNPT